MANAWFICESCAREIKFKRRNTKARAERQNQKKKVVIIAISLVKPCWPESRKAIS